MGAISLVTALTGFELGSGGIEPTTTCYRDRTRDLSLAEIMCGLGSTQLGAIPPPSLEAKFFEIHSGLGGILDCGDYYRYSSHLGAVQCRSMPRDGWS